MTGESYALALEVKAKNQGYGIAKQLERAVESTLRKWSENTQRIKMNCLIVPSPGKSDIFSAYTVAISLPSVFPSSAARKKDLDKFNENLKQPDYKAMQGYLATQDQEAWKQILLSIMGERNLADFKTLDEAGYDPLHSAIHFFKALRNKPVSVHR